MPNQYNCVPPCTELLLMQKDIKNIDEKIDILIDKVDKIEQSKADRWVERFIFLMLLFFATAAIYYIFQSVGLPID